MSNSNLTKIAVFFDGNYFHTVNNYYRFTHPIQQNINFSGLAEYLRERIAEIEENRLDYCRIVEAHWFRGKFTMKHIKDYHENDEKILQALTTEKYLDDSLMFANIVQHVFPMKVDTRTNRVEEKGLDVWFALEAYELALHKGWDILCLVGCDTDYLPLVRKLASVGTKVCLVSWDIEETKTVTSQSLINECPIYLPMHAEIEERARTRDHKKAEQADKIFFGIDYNNNRTERTFQGTSGTSR